MRLGGPVFGEWKDPAGWAKAAGELGYGAVYCPAKPTDDNATVAAYEKAAARAGLVIAEVGAVEPAEPERVGSGRGAEKMQGVAGPGRSHRCAAA